MVRRIDSHVMSVAGSQNVAVRRRVQCGFRAGAAANFQRRALLARAGFLFRPCLHRFWNLSCRVKTQLEVDWGTFQMEVAKDQAAVKPLVVVKEVEHWNMKHGPLQKTAWRNNVFVRIGNAFWGPGV